MLQAGAEAFWPPTTCKHSLIVPPSDIFQASVYLFIILLN
jgi:hypothetical protein